MFKKKVLLALGMAAVLSTGCAATSVWAEENADVQAETESTDTCLLYTSPSPRDTR